MRFTAGQIVILADAPPIAELMRGRAGRIREVIEGDTETSYIVSVNMILTPVRECDLRIGDTQEIIQ